MKEKKEHKKVLADIYKEERYNQEQRFAKAKAKIEIDNKLKDLKSGKTKEGFLKNLNFQKLSEVMVGDDKDQKKKPINVNDLI